MPRNALPGVEQHNFVRQCHGLDLVVCHVNHARGADLPVQAGNFQPGLHAQSGVQVGQRLVKQKHLGLFDNRPPNRHALPLAAGQGLGQAVQQGGELQDLGRMVDLGFNGGGVGAKHLEAKTHVVPHRHVRVQRVALKHHGHAALGGRQVVDALAINEHLTRGNVLQPGHHAQQR